MSKVITIGLILALAGLIGFSITPTGREIASGFLGRDRTQAALRDREAQLQRGFQQIPPTTRKFPNLADFPKVATAVSGDIDGTNDSVLERVSVNDETHAVAFYVKAGWSETKAATSAAVLKLVTDIFIGVFDKSSLPVQTATVHVSMMTVGKYRSRFYEQCYSARLTVAQAKTIDWSINRSRLEQQVLPNTWQVLEDSHHFGTG